jgi:hypothetical protein
MEEEKPKDIEIANTSFFSNNFTFQIAGNEVYVDFCRITPRFDGVHAEAAYWVKEHSTMVMSISLFKDLIVLSSMQLKALEEKFGEITPPEFMKNLSAEQQRAIEEAKKKQEKESSNEKPAYLG